MVKGALRYLVSLSVLTVMLWFGPEHAARAREQLDVAVASNFLQAARDIGSRFEKRTGCAIRLISGSTGKLYAQIHNGAPWQVFLAADAERPELLEKEGLALPGSRFTYAVGRLALYTADTKLQLNGLDILRSVQFRRFSIANPVTAPYGAAAREVLQGQGLYPLVKDKLVVGENITQAFQYVATGNAQLGFVALAQLKSNEVAGSYWVVPADLHSPLRQQAVILRSAGDNPLARDFAAFLRSDEIRALLREQYGYDSEQGG